MSSIVQFYGTDNVVKAFEHKDMPNWAIFQGKCLNHKCTSLSMDESGKALMEYLQMLEGGTTAVYTLKVYEFDTINEKTACDGSFNFRLTNQDEYNSRRNSNGEYREKLADRLDRIEKILAEEVEEEEPKESMLGKIGNVFINDPTKVPQMIAALQSVLSLVLPGLTKPQQPTQQAIPIYQPAQAATMNGIDESDEQLSKAIEQLKRNDPKITEHLSKLAKLSEEDKQTFGYLLSMLDNMPA